MEDCYLALATERLFLPLLRTVLPEIRDYFFPWEGVFHNLVVVSINKAYPGHAQKVMSGLWGQGQMSFCKTIVVIDADVDPRDVDRILDLMTRRMDHHLDLVHTTGILDVLDHCSPFPNFGAKLGIDLTTRIDGEPPRGPTGTVPYRPLSQTRILAINRAIDTGAVEELWVGRADSRSRRRLIAVVVNQSEDRSGSVLAESLLADGVLADNDVAMLFDAPIDLGDSSRLLWKLFNNTDPGRDLFVQNNRAVIDACRKGPADGHQRQWPEALTFD
jgi:4-hydroxy-3-polyprenylbenzoate decarboxylase